MGRYIDDILQPGETVLYSTNVHRTARRTMKTEVTHMQVLHETPCGVGESAERIKIIAAPLAFRNHITSPKEPRGMAIASRPFREFFTRFRNDRRSRRDREVLETVAGVVGSQRQDGAAAQDQPAEAPIHPRRRLPQVRAQRPQPELSVGPEAARYRLRRGPLCEPFTRLGAQVIGVDPSATNIAAAKLHAEKAHLSIDYRCTTVEDMDVRERFDIILAMEVVEHVADVGLFLDRCAAMLKPGGIMVASTLNRNWKSFALGIVAAEYVLRWLPRGTHQWDKFVTPDELARHLERNGLGITEQSGVVYSPFADKWSLSSDMDVNYMVVAESVG